MTTSPDKPKRWQFGLRDLLLWIFLAACVCVIALPAIVASSCRQSDESQLRVAPPPTPAETGGSNTSFFFEYHLSGGIAPDTYQRLLITTNEQYRPPPQGHPATEHEDYWREEYVVDEDVASKIARKLWSCGFFTWKSTLSHRGGDGADFEITVAASDRRYRVNLGATLSVDEVRRASPEDRAPNKRDTELIATAKRFFELVDAVRRIAEADGVRVAPQDRGPSPEFDQAEYEAILQQLIRSKFKKQPDADDEPDTDKSAEDAATEPTP